MPKAKKSKVLDLIIDPNFTGDSVLKMGWCIDKDYTIGLIENKEMVNPHILVVSIAKQTHNYADGSSWDQYTLSEAFLRPLKEGMVHIPFHRSGTHIVRACIVAPSDHQLSTLHKWFADTYAIAVDFKTGKLTLRNQGIYLTRIGDASRRVEVDGNFFAKEPSPAMKKWVNLLYSKKNTVDECHFRKRALVAFTLQPFVLLLSLIFRFVLTTIATFLGYRSISYLATIDVINYDLLDNITQTRDISDSIFISKKDGGPRLWAMPFLPLIPAGFVLLNFMASAINEEGKGVIVFSPSWDNLLLAGQRYGYFLGVYFGLLIIIGLLMLLAPKAVGVMSGLFHLLTSTSRTTEAMLANQLGEIKYLGCEKRMGMSPSLKSIPEHNQTFYLRFHDLKSRICKPFQRG